MNGKKISVLGSTGSIGTQSLEVIQSLGYEVNALSAGSNYKLLAEQCRRHKPVYAWIDESYYSSLKLELADTDIICLSGRDELCWLAAYEKNDIVLNSLLGISGLRPTAAALGAGKTVALANKETLVTGGELIMPMVKNGAELLPVDSEHSAVFQCLQGQEKPDKIILTASGGAFYNLTKEELSVVTAADALKHPTWRMGAKITVDCASMMNKGFELIEAAHLFGVAAEQIEIIIHRESIVHSMVCFADGSVIAQLGAHDMRLPIQYALTYPERTVCIADKLELSKVGCLHFEEPDYSRFPMLTLAVDAFSQGGLKCAALNGADEQAVGHFLKGETGFLRMQQLISDAVADCRNFNGELTLDLIEQADLAAREYVKSRIVQL